MNERAMAKKALPKTATMSKQTSFSITSTMLGSLLGTAALVGMHHHYRKQRQLDARLHDYLTGISAQLRSLQSLSVPKLTRLQYATSAWQQAYKNYPNASNTAAESNKVTTDFAAIHTTTMLARPVCWVSGVASMPKNISLINDDNNDNENGFGVVGIDANRQIVWQTTMPERVHDIVVQPLANNVDNRQNYEANRRDVVVMGRRPSEYFWVLDTTTGQVTHTIKAATDRHFYGHACYSLDGKSLYVTENDTVSLAGKIGIYAVNQGYQKVAEFDSHGIGPHELIMHPDSETLIVANGGIKTEQASREELNLDSMRPSLVYLNRHDGVLLEQIVPEHNQMSIRHLAMHDDGTVMIGIQFQGEKHINVPLVLTHKRGDTDFEPLIMPNNQWQRFHQYIASVAVDSEQNLLCVTTPIGGCAAIYDLTTRQLIDAVRLPDCAGASVLFSQCTTSANDDINELRSGFVVSDGQGQLTTLFAKSSLSDSSAKNKPSGLIIKDSQLHKMSFDNHLQAL